MKKKKYKYVKRFLDILLSGIALIVLSPLYIVIAIGIKLSSEGPVLYKTERAGIEAKPFTLLKFRSMHQFVPDASQIGQDREGGFLANEKRVFPFGGFLRKSKLDELPQLVNVLKGDISIVGIRPLTMKGVKRRYVGRFECLNHIKPGLSGLDSLYDYAHGELFVKDEAEYANTVLPVRLELAKIYGEKQSFRTDVFVVVRTIWLIISILFAKKRDIPYTKDENIARNNVLTTDKEVLI